MNKYSQFQSETLFPVGSQMLNLYIKYLGEGGCLMQEKPFMV